MAELFFEDERMGIQDPIFNNQLQNEAFSDLRYQDMGGVHPPLRPSNYGQGIRSIYHPMVDQPEDWRENIDINTLATYPQPFSPPNMLDVSGRVGEYGQIPGQGNVDMFSPEKRGFPFSGIFAGLADKVEGTVLPIDKPDMQVITTRIPIGVIAAIIPWNSQMLLTAVKLAPALAMGNTVVIKSSELAPATMIEIGRASCRERV